MRIKLSRDYLAGLFDGEGYVGLTFHHRRTTHWYFRPVVTIAQRHPLVLDLIKAQFKLDGRVVNHDNIGSLKGSCPTLRLQGPKPVLKFLKIIRGRVVVKHSQVELMITALSSNLKSSELRGFYEELRRLKIEREA